MWWGWKLVCFVLSVCLAAPGLGEEASRETAALNITAPAVSWTAHVDGSCGNYVVAGECVVVRVCKTKPPYEHLEARRLSNGTLVWTNPADVVAIGPVYNGNVIAATRKSVVAIDFTSGKEQWRSPWQPPGHFSAPPTLDGKHLYVADFSPEPEHGAKGGPRNFYCLDADTGRKLWHVTIPRGVVGAPASFDDRNIYLVHPGLGVSCISKKTRRIAWSSNVHTTGSPAVCSSGSIVVPARAMECFAAEDGSSRWKIAGAPNNYRCKVKDGIVYTAVPRQSAGPSPILYPYFDAIDVESGKIVWSRRFPAPVRGEATLDGDRVYLTCWDDNLYCLHLEDGRVLWQFALPLEQWAPTPLLCDKGLLLCFKDRVVCIGQKQ